MRSEYHMARGFILLTMRIAVLGLGFMGSTHLKALRATPGAEVVAVASDDERQLSGDLSGVQGNIGGPGGRMDFSGLSKYRNWQDAVTDPAVEAVDICLPTGLHAPAAIAALGAGKHVLVEKPMALDGEAADAMLYAARASGRVLMVAQTLRFFPAYRVLAEAVRSGRLGQVCAAMFQRRCAAPQWSPWLLDRSVSGGAAFDLLVHDVDFCLHLFGAPLSVSAVGHEDLGHGTDWITAGFHYDAAAVVVAGGWYPSPGFPFSMEYSVAGSGGVLEYSSAGVPPTLYAPDGTRTELAVAGKDGYQAEIEYFVECCLEGRQPDLCPPAESAKAVRLAELMLESRAKQGEKLRCLL